MPGFLEARQEQRSRNEKRIPAAFAFPESVEERTNLKETEPEMKKAGWSLPAILKVCSGINHCLLFIFHEISGLDEPLGGLADCKAGNNQCQPDIALAKLAKSAAWSNQNSCVLQQIPGKA